MQMIDDTLNTAPIRPVNFRGMLTKKQFSTMQKALLPKWARWYVILPGYFYVFLFSTYDWRTLLKHPLWAVPDLLIAVVGLMCTWGLIVYLSGRAWKTTTNLQGEIHGQVNESGIEWNTAISSSKFPWAKLLRVKETEQMLLVLYTPRCAFYFPRNFFASDDEWLALKNLLASRLRK
jgi:YcxB-like protein